MFRWLQEKGEFLEQYEIAKQESADAMAEEVLDIADDGANDWMERKDKEGECIGWQFNGKVVSDTPKSPLSGAISVVFSRCLLWTTEIHCFFLSNAST